MVQWLCTRACGRFRSMTHSNGKPRHKMVSESRKYYSLCTLIVSPRIMDSNMSSYTRRTPRAKLVEDRVRRWKNPGTYLVRAFVHCSVVTQKYLEARVCLAAVVFVNVVLP